jgi:aryl-alcohol dehydrogenase-like predicted oxidoreductase
VQGSPLVENDTRRVEPIPKRPLGRTGAQISVVGLGAGSRFYRSVPDDEQAAELVRRSIDPGIEFMETSANYGPDGLSEKRIRLAMKTHRSKVFLETKVDERTYGDGRYATRASEETPEEAMLAVAGNAYTALVAGFTTVQGLGSPSDGPLRDAIARGTSRRFGVWCSS